MKPDRLNSRSVVEAYQWHPDDPGTPAPPPREGQIIVGVAQVTR